MKIYDIPTAEYVNFTSFDDLIKFFQKDSNEYNNIKKNVLKLDGLAGGKGVFLPNSYNELLNDIEYIKNDLKLKIASVNMLYERRLYGIEFSLHAF